VKAATGEEVDGEEVGPGRCHARRAGVAITSAQDDAHALSISAAHISRQSQSVPKASATMGTPSSRASITPSLEGVVSAFRKTYKCERVMPPGRRQCLRRCSADGLHTGLRLARPSMAIPVGSSPKRAPPVCFFFFLVYLVGRKSPGRAAMYLSSFAPGAFVDLPARTSPIHGWGEKYEGGGFAKDGPRW